MSPTMIRVISMMTTSESDIYELYLAYKSYERHEQALDLREDNTPRKRSQVTLFVFNTWKSLWLGVERNIPSGAWETP